MTPIPDAVSGFEASVQAGGGHELSSEEKVVKAICDQFGAPFGALLKASQDAVGKKPVTLAFFLDRYSGFPVWVGYRTVSYMRDVFGELDAHFTKTPCYQAWEEVLETNPDDRPTACFLQWPHFGRCVIHDPHLLPELEEGLQIVRRMKSHPRPFVIEKVPQFLARISWEPPLDHADDA